MQNLHLPFSALLQDNFLKCKLGNSIKHADTPQPFFIVTVCFENGLMSSLELHWVHDFIQRKEPFKWCYR